MTHSLSIRQQRESALVAGAIGTLLVALAVMASLKEQQGLVAGLAGAVGVAMWRQSAIGSWRAPVVPLDLFAFAIFAVQRNDGLAFWQLVGPWADVARFNVTSAAIAYACYIVGTLLAFASVHRSLRPIEAAGLIATPFLFNLLITLGADWHMAEIAKIVLPGNRLPFPAQVFIGRTLTLIFLSEVGLAVLSLMALNRLQDSLKLHVLIVVSAALGAGTPLIANFAQVVVTPFLAIFVSAAAAALAQAGLWGVVYVATGLPLDALAGRPPSFAAVYGHWRTGFVKGAIYGGVFMALVLTAAFVLGAPGVVDVLRRGIWICAPIGGAFAFPFAQTLIGSADGTPPFFGRLVSAYRDPAGYFRGLLLGLGGAYAYSVDLPTESGGARFLVAFFFGALAYAGVDMCADYRRIAIGERAKMQIWKKYALGVLLGGMVAGAIGWYFDAPQVKVVVDKFWAYADVNYRVSGRRLGDFITYPIFNKYGAINLGEVAGGVRLFWTELMSGVINWSLAAPLFSINYVLLAALLERSVQPFRQLFSAQGVEGLIEQGCA